MLSILVTSRLLLCFSLISFINASKFPLGNRTSQPSNPGCPQPSCTLTVSTTTLTYPTQFQLYSSTITATLIPVVTQYPNGTEETVTSTYAVYDTVSNSTFTTPKQLTLTWNTYGTVLTYPTTYIGFPSPKVLLHEQDEDQKCLQTTVPVPIPETASSNLVFPASVFQQDVGTDSPYLYIESLAQVTSILSGGDPTSCAHGAPRTATPQAPMIATVPAAAILYTTVDVLTEVGNPVTIRANPFTDAPPPPPPTTADSGGTTTSPQSVHQDTTLPPSTTWVVEGTTVVVDASAVVIQGTTFSKTQVFTTNSVGSTDIIIGTSTLTLVSIATDTTALHGPGAAIASGIGLNQASTSKSYPSFLIFESLAIALFFFALAWS